ncbi:hypothetical protein BJX70DRAFT_79789 [Aspergillus crustosus]
MGLVGCLGSPVTRLLILSGTRGRDFDQGNVVAAVILRLSFRTSRDKTLVSVPGSCLLLTSLRHAENSTNLAAFQWIFAMLLRNLIEVDKQYHRIGNSTEYLIKCLQRQYTSPDSPPFVGEDTD